MRTLSAGFALLALFLVTATVAATFPPALTLTISPSKSLYTRSESIVIRGELKNTGTKTLHINRNFVIHSDLIPHLVDAATKKPLSWLPPPFPAGVEKGSIVTLKPGEIEKFTWDAMDSFLSASQDGGLPPGKYLLTVKYLGNGVDFRTKQKHDCFTGTVQSNQIEFQIQK